MTLMVFIKAQRKQLLLAGSLAVAVAAFTVTGCGGGSAAALAQGSAPGQWTKSLLINGAGRAYGA